MFNLKEYKSALTTVQAFQLDTTQGWTEENKNYYIITDGTEKVYVESPWYPVVGDWIVKASDGNYYIFKDDVFKDEFTAVE